MFIIATLYDSLYDCNFNMQTKEFATTRTNKIHIFTFTTYSLDLICHSRIKFVDSIKRIYLVKKQIFIFWILLLVLTGDVS